MTVRPIVAPGGASASANSVTTDDGLTREQLLIVLQTIAGYAQTLQTNLMLAHSDDVDSFHVSSMIAASEIISRAIGGIADQASGCDVRGNLSAWFHGLSFADAGKAGAA